MKSSNFKAGMGVLAVGALVVGSMFAGCGYVYGTEAQADVVVKSLDHKITNNNGGNGSIKDVYLVFTDHGVFKNEDCLFRGKFDSSDLQNALKPGDHVRIRYYGWRIPVFSAYPNIFEVISLPQ